MINHPLRLDSSRNNRELWAQKQLLPTAICTKSTMTIAFRSEQKTPDRLTESFNSILNLLNIDQQKSDFFDTVKHWMETTGMLNTTLVCSPALPIFLSHECFLVSKVLPQISLGFSSSTMLKRIPLMRSKPSALRKLRSAPASSSRRSLNSISIECSHRSLSGL